MDSLHRDTESEAEALLAAAPGIESPSSIGQDERRMHVRAYNFWAKLLDGRSFPAIEALDLDNLGDFGPNAVLLDFTSGLDNPAIGFVGEALAQECELDEDVQYIADVPRRSLLTRLTDHYLQIIANRAPIGFEAEFVNSRGTTIMYRGVLLPFSSDDDTIDFILGVINWKQSADAELTQELNEEVAAAMRTAPAARPSVPLWADGPEAANALAGNGDYNRDQLFAHDDDLTDASGFMQPKAEWAPPVDDNELLLDAPISAFDATDEDTSLADWLAAARESAEVAAQANARGHDALYQAIGRAWGFARTAQSQPEDLAEILDEAGIAASPRSPMTPVVKLVFGAAHDKTRLAEFALILTHAQTHDLDPAQLPQHLAKYDGGLKGLLRTIRAEKRQGMPVVDKAAEAEEVLRAADSLAWIDLPETGEDAEFVVLVARRIAGGSHAILAQIPHDGAVTKNAIAQAARIISAR